jgi:hypothetical protein
MDARGVAMVGKYCKRVCRRAIQEALRALGLESPERAVLRIITAIFGVAAVWYFTEDHTTANLILRLLALQPF